MGHANLALADISTVLDVTRGVAREQPQETIARKRGEGTIDVGRIFLGTAIHPPAENRHERANDELHRQFGIVGMPSFRRPCTEVRADEFAHV